ncbi:MAG: AMP-binding protein [Butyrivibrio sp.]|nr:AMP-binding protein [Acetatifactor muris]MCM1558923.1 AMP-binding protein [Butyrivibrio sp.]
MRVLSDIVIEYGTRNPEKTAVINGDKKISYARLIEQMEAVSNGLQEMGVREQDRIVYSAASKAEYIILYLAILNIRAVSVPVLKSASLEDVSYISDLTKAKMVVSDSPKLKELKNIISYKELLKRSKAAVQRVSCKTEILPDDITEILFTSGTTGKPKGVVHSYRAIYANTINTIDGMGMREEDILLLPLPLNHSFGMRVLRSALYNGGTIVLQNGFSFARELKDNIEQNNCNCMVCVASGFEMIKQQIGKDYQKILSRLRYIEFSAGPVPKPLRKELCDSLPETTIYNTWGSTETGGALFLDVSHKQDKTWSAGAPINDIQIKIVDDSFQELPHDGHTVGRLALKGDMLLSGYYRNEKLSAEYMRDGWFITNDAVSIDEESYVRMRGRVDDIISVGGEKVAPADVERLVEEACGMPGCVCVGVTDPDGILGSVPVVFAAGKFADQKKIEEYIRTKGNSFMVPRAFVTVPEIPRNYMGKIDRKALKQLWDERLLDRDKREEHADSAALLLNLIKGRRSIRNFTDRVVEAEKLSDILEAGRYAPSGHNMQTWRFTVLTDSGEIQKLKNVIEPVAKEKGTPFYGFLNPRNAIIVSNDRRNNYGIQDCAAATENMLLMAHAHGLGAVWLNSCLYISDEPPIREQLRKYEIPDSHVVYGIIALGYYDDPVKIPAKKENIIFYYRGDEE